MMSIPRSKRRAAVAGAATVCLSVVLFLKLSPIGEAVGNATLVPLLAATKTATLQTDNTVPSNGIVNPGDRLRYLVTINNTAAAGAGNEALNVAINDTVDANTTLVGGSVIASAIAVNDSYSSIGNVGITVPDGVGDLLANDLDANNLATPVLNITQINGAGFTFGNSVAITNGSVTVNANGSFSFTPAAGFEGNASFTYTLSNGTTLTDTATVTIGVSGMIWFVNPAAGAGGDGRLNTPFNCFVGVNCFDDTTLDEAGDNIFLYSGAHIGGQTLLNNQRLIGQGATTALAGAGSITGITIPTFSNTLPTTGGANPTMTTTVAATNAITLGQGNTIRGITFGNTTGAKLFATATVGALTIGPASGTSDVTLNGTGQAISLTGGGTLAARFASISSANSAAGGITLTSVGGSFVSPTNTLTNPTTFGISIGSSTATFDLGNTTANQSGGTGISLTSNTGTITFADLDIAPDSGQRGLLATSNAGLITIPSGTIGTTDGTAVEITGASAVSLTPVNIQFTSVSTTGTSVVSSPAGIRLINTSSSGGPGGFSIVGTGTTDGSGGVISNITGADGSLTAGIGIYLSNVSNISLTNMNITGNFGNWGIRGDNVNNFTLRDSNIFGTLGTNIALDEGAMRFGTQGATTGLKGTALFEGNTVGGTGAAVPGGGAGGGLEDNLTVYVMGSDTLTLNVRDNLATGSPAIFNNNNTVSGNDDMLVESGGTSNVTIMVDGVNFNGARGDLIQTAAIGSSTQNVTIQNSAFHNVHSNIITGGGGLVVVGSGTNYNVTYRIHNNTFKGVRASPIFAMFGGVSGVINGVITNNVIGTNNGVFDSSQANRGSQEGMGIFAGIDSKQPGNNSLTHALRIEGNTLRDINGAAGILFRSNSQDNLGTCRFEATITNNTLAEMGPNPAGGIYGQVGGASLNNDAGKMGLNISTNSINMAGALFADAVVLDQSSVLAQFYLPGYAGPAAPTNQVSTFLTGTKGNTFVLPAGNNGTGGAYANSNAVFGTNFVLAVPSFASLEPRPAETDRASLDLTDLYLDTAGTQLALLADDDSSAAPSQTFPSDDATTENTDDLAGARDYLTTIHTFLANQIGVGGRTFAGIASLVSPTVGAQAISAPESGENVNRLLGTLPPGENIRVQFDVTIDANLPTNDFSVSNQGTISATGVANFLTDDPAVAGTANPTVTGVVHPPTVSKAFGAANIPVGGTTSLTFTIGNANPATAFTNVAFSDTLPAGMVISTPNGLVNNCGGGTITAVQNTSLFSVSALSRAANSTCTIVINVTGTTDGGKNNVTGTISSTQGGTGLTASASTTVIAAPSFSKSFGAATIPLNGFTSLTFTITNNSANSQLTGIAFTDILPAGLVVATPNGQTGTCGGGAITATQATGTVSLSGATLAASTNCVFSVNVTGITFGVKNNSVQMSSTQLGNGATANASVTVIPPPTIAKSFNPTTVVANNGFSTMTIAITNPAGNAAALTGVAVTDTFPAGMEVDAVPTATNSCATGTFAPVAAATSVSISGATIPAATTCNFTVHVRGTTAGAKLNTTGAVSSTNGGTGLTASATLTVTNTVVWNGSQAGGAWTTALNWTPNVVPVSTNDVDIPAAGVANNPVISSAVTVNNLTEAVGRTLTINATFSMSATGICTINGTLSVAGSFNCGTLAGTGTVAFTGAAAQNIPALTYNNLTINNAAGTNLSGNTTVNGALTFTNGVINTGANILTVGTAGTTSRTNGHVVGNLRKLFTAPGSFIFHVGTTGYSPISQTVTAMTSASGELTASANAGVPSPTPPGVDPLRTLQRYWTLTGTGIRSDLTFNYLDTDVLGAPNNENLWAILRITGTTAVAYPDALPYVTMSPATNQFTITGLESYSHWTAGEPLAPTAANASVSGRILDSNGRGVSGAHVMMQDQSGNIIWATTNPFGYYRFASVPVGQSYLVTPRHKRHAYESRSVTVNDDLGGLDFIPLP